METNPAVAPAASVTAALPSSTFSVSLVNAVLGMFLESAASIEEIANENNLSIPVVMQCLDEQKPFLLSMLSTIELRVRMLAARAEAVAIEALREVAIFARDQEARRKAASKLLSHFAKAKSQRTPGASPGPHVPAHAHKTTDALAPSPSGTISQPVAQRTPIASPGPHVLAHAHKATDAVAPSPSGTISQPVAQRTPGATPGPHVPAHGHKTCDAVAPLPDATLPHSAPTPA